MELLLTSVAGFITMFVYYLVVPVTFFVAIDGAEFHLRIKGGHTKTIQSHPSIVSIQRYGHQLCGGAIISKDIVITAAHCVPFNIEDLTINAGSSYSNKSNVVRQVSKKIVHNGYKRISAPVGTSLINDIALFKITPPFVFNNDVASISMFNAREQIAPGTRATLSGWGHVPQHEKQISNTEDVQFNQLRSADLAIVDKDECRGLRESVGRILSPGEICAHDFGKDACVGDSGGPLVVNGRLAGLVSHGPPCDEQNYYPGIYTEIAYFRKWIDENMKKLTAN